MLSFASSLFADGAARRGVQTLPLWFTCALALVLRLLCLPFSFLSSAPKRRGGDGRDNRPSLKTLSPQTAVLGGLALRTAHFLRAGVAWFFPRLATAFSPVVSALSPSGSAKRRRSSLWGAVGALCCLLLLAPVTSWADDGALDTGFGNGLAVAGGYVRAVAVQGDGKVLIGGTFTSVNGTTRGYIARLNSDGSLDTGFGNGLAGADGPVQAVAVQGDGKVIIGGAFTTVNGTNRSFIARLNSDGSLDTGFGNGLTGANNTVYAVAVQGDGKVIIGGAFTTVNGTNRSFIARLNSDCSVDTGFGNGLAGASSFVLAVAVQGDGKVIIGGAFTTVNGTTQNRIARLNSDGALDTGFGNGLTGANNTVRAVAVQGDGKVIIGGDFTTVNGTTRGGIARLNSDGSLDTGFGNGLAGADGPVYAVAVQGDGKVLIGGGFTTINGTTRNHIARLNSDGALDTGFGNGLAGANSIVYAVAVQGDGKVLIGGNFTSVNGTTQNRIARLNSNGSLVNSNGALDTGFGNGLAGANSSVYAVAVQGDGKVIIGGAFTTVNGTNRGSIARLNSDGSLDTSFGNGLAGANDGVYAVAVQGDGKVLIGGFFTTVNGTTRTRIARLNSDGSVDTSFGNGLAGANSTVLAVAVQGDGKVLIGGGFSTVNGTNRGSIARLNSDGSVDTGFGNALAGASGTVSTVAVQGDGKVIIGGFFTTVNGTTRNRIARLNSDGSLDTSFGNGLAGASSFVLAVAVQGDGKVIIGGAFTTVNGTTQNRIARLNSDGSLDTSFGNGLAGANSSVYAMAVQGDGKVLIGGDFTTVNGTTRTRIARLGSDGSVDTSFGNGLAGANSTVRAVAVQGDGKVLIGGDFTTVNGTTQNRIARLAFTAAPTITSFTSTSGPVGTSVVITGTGFTGATNVSFNGTSAGAVNVGYVINSDTQITATVPTGATTGTLSVTTAGGTATSTGTFTVLSTVSVAVAPASVLENSGTPLAYTFTRSGALNTAITVNFTVGGTATFSSDYTQTGAASFSTTTGTVSFAANATTATVNLTPVADFGLEPNETAILTLAAGTGYSAVAPTAATGTITNDDSGLVVTTTSDAAANGSDNDNTLREAINTANGLSSNDTISFSTLFNTPQTITLAGGELALLNNGTLTITGPSAATLTVSGNSASRIFNVASGLTASVSNLTLSGGKTTSGNYGGAITSAGTLTLTSCALSSNLTESFFGGAVYNTGSLTLNTCSVTGNTANAVGGGTGNGGAIFNETGATLVANNSSFNNNTAGVADTIGGYGGAILSNDGALVTLTGSTFAGNTAITNGGALFNNGPLNITNCSFGTNTAGNEGGAIFHVGSSTLTINNSTVFGNTATSGRGGGVSSPDNTLFVLGNTIIAGNTAPTAPDLLATTTGGGSNLVQNISGAALFGTNITGQSAGLGPLQSNGGPTATFALLSGSSAVNTGSNALVPADTLDIDGDGNTTEALPYDQRGAGFPRIVGGTVDIGAYESSFVPPTITSFTPTSGTIGTSVVITGANFTGATSVTFNGTSATTYTVNSDTQITATVPTGATTGTISVIAPGGTVTSAGTFTVLSSVSVAVSPASVLENSSTPLVYTFTRSGALNAAITVNFALTGTATYGTDYTQSGAASYNTTNNTGTVSFAINATTATVNLTPVIDTTIEPNETAIVTLAAGSGYSAVAPTSATGTIQNDDFTPVATSGLLIGEFRAHGSSGALDEYIELANSTTGVLSIGGWKVRYLSGGSLVTATIPANTTIPAMGHYLFTGSGYNTTLSGISGSDQTLANPMDDATGITLLNAASTVVDAVSFAGSSMAGEGTLLPSAPTANGEYAFERRQSSGTPAGVPLDNNTNSGDFIFVSTTGGAFASITGAGTTTTLSSTLGAPSPNSTTGYVQTGSVAQTLLDTSVANSVAPNRVRLNAVDSGVTGAPDRFGTLRLRRTLTNNGGTTYTRVRFHVVTITTYSAGGLGGYSDLNQADVRLLTSPDETGIATSTGAKNVIGTSVQAPATGAMGGGLNANTVVLNQALTPGSSANYSFELGVARKGNFLVGFTIELLP